MEILSGRFGVYARLQEAVALPLGTANALLTIWQVEYAGVDVECYAVPPADDELQALLEIYLLHRTIDEWGNHLAAETALVRPACEGVPGLLQPQQKR
jgi:hypothetical protein